MKTANITYCVNCGLQLQYDDQNHDCSTEQDEIVNELRQIDNEIPEYSGSECWNDPNYVDF